jgi:hypothetical protein
MSATDEFEDRESPRPGPAGESARLFDADADPQLVAQGWERRFVTDGQRASEIIDLYRQLGFEARLEPLQAEGAVEDCADCRLVQILHLAMVYTRRASQ